MEREWQCPKCGYEGRPIVDESNYGSALDGNRSRELVTKRCPNCDYEIGRFV